MLAAEIVFAMRRKKWQAARGEDGQGEPATTEERGGRAGTGGKHRGEWTQHVRGARHTGGRPEARCAFGTRAREGRRCIVERNVGVLRCWMARCYRASDRERVPSRPFYTRTTVRVPRGRSGTRDAVMAAPSTFASLLHQT